MINEGFIKKRAHQIVANYGEHILCGTEAQDEQLIRECERCFIRGVDFAQAIIKNALFKSCDDLGIGFENQKQILEGIKEYINR